MPRKRKNRAPSNGTRARTALQSSPIIAGRLRVLTNRSIAWFRTARRAGFAGRFLAWAGGGLFAFVATVATAQVSGVLQQILPGPADAICRFIQAPYLEESLSTPLPGVLVISFPGPLGRDAARNLADEVRSRTGLPVVTTCLASGLTANADATEESVTRALDSARVLAKRRGARLTVLGEMRSDGSIEVAVTNTSWLSDGHSDAERSWIRFTEAPSSTRAVRVEDFIDTQFLKALEDWARDAVSELQVSHRIARPLAEREADSLSWLARHDPPRRWDAKRARIAAFWSYAYGANAYVSANNESCIGAEEAHRYGGLLHRTSDQREEPNAEVALRYLEMYLFCKDAPLSLAPEKLIEQDFSDFAAFIDELGSTDELSRIEEVIEKDSPWSYGSEHVLFGNVTLAKALLEADGSEVAWKEKAVRAAHNLLRADVREKRAVFGTPTEAERQSSAQCLRVFGYSIEMTQSWKILAARGIDPTTVFANPKRGSGVIYCWENKP